MKKLVFVFALVAMAFAGSAFAQAEYTNNLGVYFDADGTMASNNDGMPGLKHVYVVMTNLTVDTVEGFECKITATGGMLISYDSMVFPVDAINVGTRFGEVIAGFGAPMMVEDGKVMVMEFDIVVTDPGMPGSLFIDPVYFPSHPGAPAFLSGGEIYEARNSTAPGLPVLVTNSETEPVATDATSFDNLKSLYR
jgi:hypothetical protein